MKDHIDRMDRDQRLEFISGNCTRLNGIELTGDEEGAVHLAATIFAKLLSNHFPDEYEKPITTLDQEKAARRAHLRVIK